MLARYASCFVLLFYFATITFGAEPEEGRPPQELSQPLPEKSSHLSALDHLRLAREQLEAAGLAEEAVKLKELSDQVNRRIAQERDALSRQVSELQKKSELLRKLTGKPDKIRCRCCFLELTEKAAAEFAAASEPVSSKSESRSHSDRGTLVYRNAEEVIRQLKKSGGVTVVHASPQIVTTPGQPVTATSGGEFPILIPLGDNQTSFEWKHFGVRCKVVPRLLDTGRIQLQFCPEISYRDFTNSVNVNGLTVPGLTIRRVNAQAEMNFGETLVVRTVSENIVTLFMVTPVAIE